MTLTQLEYAVAVAHHLHFGRAAAACHVSQPSLSVQIQKLEDELDVRLFERSKSAVTVTEVGRAVIDQARLVLGETQRIDDIVGVFRTEIKGTLRLGLIPTIAPFLLPSILPRMQAAHPLVRLEIFEQTTAVLLAHLERGEIDAAILSMPRTGPESLREKVLYYEPFVLFAAKGHALRTCNPVRTSDIRGHAAQLLDDTHCMRDQVAAICSSAARGDPAIQIKSGTLQTLVEVVKATGGYTLLPALATGLFKHHHGTYLIEFAEPKPSRKVSLVFHRSFLKRPLIEALASLIHGHLPPGVLPISLRAKTKVLDPQASRFAPA